MTAQSFAYLACSIMTLYILYLRLKNWSSSRMT